MPYSTGQRIRALQLVAVLVVSSAPALVRGEDRPPAIGTRAVITPGAVLKVGDRVVDTGNAHHVYTVERASGDWLWLTSGAIGGWARAADVIPLDRAIDLYSATIKSDPNAAWAYYNRGLIWHDRRDFDRAIADYSEALRLNPRSVAALVNRGNAETAVREFDRAIADYDQALRLDPKNRLAYLNRGIARQAGGEFARAIADYDEAIGRGLKTAQAYNNRGHAWELMKDYDRAITDYTEAIRLGPNSPLSWLNRGNARKAKGKFNEALADYQSATRLEPKSPWGYALQASLLAAPPEAKDRDGPRAVELATKASELGGTTNAYLSEIRAAAHAAAGEPDRAREWQAKAREAASRAPVGDPVAQRARRLPNQPQRPYIQTSNGPFGGSTSGADASGNVVSNPGGSPSPSDGQTNSFYGANYVLPPTGGSTAALTRGGTTNIGYSSPVSTYYSGNVPYSSGSGAVRPVDPTYYGANYSGKSITTTEPPSPNSIGFSYYGANYSGTATFNPSPTSGYFPNNPTGTSFSGADYSGRTTFTPGSPP